MYTYFVFYRDGIMYIPNSWNWIFPISMTVERMRMKNSNKSLRGKKKTLPQALSLQIPFRCMCT
jgi:hypothetical protein